jgi:ribosome-associated protein
MKPEALLTEVLNALDDKKGNNILALNLQGISLLADYFVICHGNSTPQVQALAMEVRKRASEMGINVKGIEGYDTAKWVLVDLGDVVVHVFHKDDREYYNIERLWSDAKVVEHV